MSPTDLILSFLGVLLTIFVLSAVFGSFFTVETAQVAIVQRLGKFSRAMSKMSTFTIEQPGLAET